MRASVKYQMCPLRFILVFFSAVLAGYFAWKTIRSSPDADMGYEDSLNEKILSPKEEQETNFKRVCFNSLFFYFYFLLLLLLLVLLLLLRG